MPLRSYLPQDAFAYYVPKHGDARACRGDAADAEPAILVLHRAPGVTRPGPTTTPNREVPVIQVRAVQFATFRRGDQSVSTSGPLPRIVDTGRAGRTTSPKSATTPMWGCVGLRGVDRARPDTIRTRVTTMRKLQVMTEVGTRPEIIRLCGSSPSLYSTQRSVLGTARTTTRSHEISSRLESANPHFLNARARRSRNQRQGDHFVDAVLLRWQPEAVIPSRHQQLHGRIPASGADPVST